jgi:phospholipase C
LAAVIGEVLLVMVKRIVPVAVLAAAALLLGALTAPAAQAPASSVPVQHIVVLYLENHSFDNVLGYWCDQTHRCLGMPASVTLKGGTVVRPGVTPDTVPNVDHSVRGQKTAIDGGNMDGWAQVSGCAASTGYACISGYEPSGVPNFTALASKFAISDQTFSMQNSPSWGGHLYAVMASSDGFTGNNPVTVPGVKAGSGWGCDSNRVATWVSPGGAAQTVPSCVPDRSLKIANGGAFRPTPVHQAPTIMDLLDSAGLSWTIYGSKSGQAGYIWATCPSIAECLYTQQSHIRESERFVTDAQAGHLPNFSLVVPGDTTNPDSQHNGTSMTAGDNWVGQVASAVMNGPQWNSTALFITYDDCGCFYDQVPPGTNPDGTAQGPRTPLLIVSPYARPGFTDSTPTTFAGILTYTEQTLGLRSLSKNDARGYGFANAFNYNQKPLTPAPMVHRPLPATARHLPPPDPNDPT